MQEKFTVLIYMLWAAAKKRSLQEIVALSMYVVTFNLISNLATDYIQKRRVEPGPISFE